MSYPKEEHPTFKGWTEITDPLEVKRIFETSEFRLVTEKDRWGGKDHTYTSIEIKFQDHWLGVCRTDLMDNVATGWVETKTLEEWVEHYRRKIGSRGARYSDRSFAIIDAWSDG